MRFILAMLVALMAMPATAEESARKVLFEGNEMTVKSIGDNTIEIAYIDPPTSLREIGIQPGSVVIRGKWNARDFLLEGDAYLYAKDCEPISYPVRGVVDEMLWLIVLGPTPVLDGCKSTGRAQWTSASIMRFEPIGRLPTPSDSNSSKRKREERKVEDKPKPKPKAKPKAKPAQPHQPQPSPYWYYPQQRSPSPYNWQ